MAGHPRRGERHYDEEEDADLEAGESEDGDELSETPPPHANKITNPIKQDDRIFSSEEIERRKSHLKKALDAFEKTLEKYLTESNAVISRLPAQTTFILNLMVFACTKDQPKIGGTSVRLMSFTPEPNSDRDLTFVVRAGRILQSIWIGGRTGPVIDKLQIDRRRGMADDVFFFIVASRWAITRACLATDGNHRSSLGKILEAAAIKIYQSTSRFGAIDPQAEYDFITKLEQSLGFSRAETNELIKNCQRLKEMLESR